MTPSRWPSAADPFVPVLVTAWDLVRPWLLVLAAVWAIVIVLAVAWPWIVRLTLAAVAVGWCVWMLAGFRGGAGLARIWPEDAPSNCFLWAMRQYAIFGGSFWMVPSQWGPWMHAYWVRPDGRAFEFVPLGAKRRHAFPPALFRGQVVERRSDTWPV